MTPPPVRIRLAVLQGVFAPGGLASGNVVQPRGAVQRKPGVDAFQVNLQPRSGGWPLPRDVQAKMESALGANFSDVRIHVGPEATAIGAIAFTWGTDIHFAPGQYSPHTPHGQSLLGHELAHVVQQRAGRVANPFGSGVAVVQDHSLEAEADRLGRMAASHRIPDAPAEAAPVPKTSGSTGTINMKPNPASVYTVRPPQFSGSRWEISVGAQGQMGNVGSLQMRPVGNGVMISDLRVQPDHRRHGLAGRLIDAAIHAARSNGFPVAQLEARPDSMSDPNTGSLVSMYQRHGFRLTGLSNGGHPLMERKV